MSVVRWRTRSGVAGFIAVLLVAGVTNAAWLAGSIATAPPAAADPPAAVPVIPPGPSTDAWGYLETDALSLLHDRGIPTDLPEQSTRGLVRSYIYLQLVALIDKAHKGETLTPQEQDALDYISESVKAERRAAALDAYAKFWQFATEEQHCSPGTGPVYHDGSPGMFGVACVFTQMFGHNPNAAQYNAIGFSEAMQAFQSGEGSRVFSDATQGLSFWNALPVLGVPGKPEAESTQEQLHEVLQEKLREAGQEALQDIATALVDKAKGESAALDLGLVAGALVMILASGIWGAINAHATAQELEEKASSTPELSMDDLAKLTQGAGTQELFYVVMAQTMTEGSAIPYPINADVQDYPGITVNHVGNFACSFAPTTDLHYSANGSEYGGCFGYTFSADPDSIEARYPAGSTPPAQTAADPQFALTHHFHNLTLGPDLAPGLQFDDRTVMPWVSSDKGGHALMHDTTSARNVDTYASTQQLVDGPNNYFEQGVDAPDQGYSSYIHNGAVVTQFARYDYPPAPNPNTWQYNQGIRYVDWNGNWWQAWYQDGEFRHVKVAEPIGPLTPGNETNDMGVGPCSWNPVTPTPNRGTIEVGDPNCLFATSNTIENVQEHDVVLVDGQVRVVRAGVDCRHWDQDNWSLFSDGWGIAATSKCGDGNGSPYYERALYLQPGVSTNWETLSVAGVFAGFIGLNNNTFELGDTDHHAMKLLKPSNLENCDDTPGVTEATATTDCFVSTTIAYKARNSASQTENWSATLAYPPQVTARANSGWDRHPYPATVATFTTDDPAFLKSDLDVLATRFSAQIEWGDGTTSAGTVTSNGMGGFDVKASHGYDEPNLYTTKVTVTDTLTGRAADDTGTFSAASSPRISAAANRPPDANGWYNHSVGVHFTCTGTGAVCPADQTLQGDGATVSSTPQTEFDPSHSISSTSNVVTAKIDTTAPAVSPTYAVNATSPSGATVDLTAAASDALSGVQSMNCSPKPSPSQFAIGNTAENCNAQDTAGNASGVTALTVHVRNAAEQSDNLVTETNADVPTGNALIGAAKAVQTAVKSNNTTTSCANLAKFLKVAGTQPTTVLSASNAASLNQHVVDLAGTLGGCPFQTATSTTLTYVNASGSTAAPRTGQNVVLIATVKQGTAAVAVGGKVQFYVNGAVLGTPITVAADGTALKATTTLLPNGTPPSVIASYLGTASTAPSTSTAVSVPVAPADTTTTLTVTPSQPATGYVYGGTPLTLKAAVSVNAPGAGSPTGTVLFYADSTLLGTAPVSSGKAAFTMTTPLGYGNHSVSATYRGPIPFNDSSSSDNLAAGNTRSVTVARTPTTTKLTAPSASTWPSLAPVTATVTIGGGSAAVPSGRVQFLVNGTAVGSSVAIGSNGVASQSLPGASIGKRTITAQYLGTDNLAASSGSASQTVLPPATTVDLTTSAQSVAPGVAVTLTATLHNAYPQTPTGSVTFNEGTTVLGTAKLGPTGSASLAVPFSSAGTHVITANYKGLAPNLGAGGSAQVAILVGTSLMGADDFVYAPVFGSASGTAPGTNEDATTQSGEPAPATGPNATVWFKWLAPSTGLVEFDTCTGTTFDTMLAAYTGSSMNALSKVAGNDDSCGVRSFIQFKATKGQTYAIQVDGYGVNRGVFTLSWSMIASPANDNFAQAQAVNSATSPVSGDLYGATIEAGEQSVGGASPQNSVWYKWRATKTGTAEFDTCASTTSMNTVMGVYTGTALNALTSVASADEGCGDTQLTKVIFPVQVNKTYVIKVDTWSPATSASPFKLSWSFVTTPANDNLVDATTLTGASGSVFGTNTNASTEAGEPRTCDDCNNANDPSGPNATVWYTWTAPSTGSVTFSMCSATTNFDSMIAVYNDPVTEETKTAEDDEGCGVANRSTVTFHASSGQTFWLQVDGYQGDTGNFTLAWSYPGANAPANDAFANATTLTGASGSQTGSSNNATFEPNEPTQFTGATKTAWYTWTAPNADPVEFDTCNNPSFNSTLAVYTGPGLDFLTPVTSNNDLCTGNSGSAVTFTPVSGQTYFIQVAGAGGSTGTFTLQWAPTPENDAFANHATLSNDAGGTTGTNVGATIENGEPMAVSGPWHSVWHQWTPSHNGTATFDTCTNTSFASQLSVWSGQGSNFNNVAMNVGASGCGTNGARVTFPVSTGVTYFISIDGASAGATGTFQLHWSLS